MKTVKVKMLSDEKNREGEPLEKGSIQELTDDSAQYWIKREKAELVPEVKKGKVPASSAEQKDLDEAAKAAADAEAKRVADELVAADQKAKDEAAKAAGAGSQPK